MGRKAKLSKEMKLRIVQEYIEGNVDISIKYGIINHSILHTWIKKYNSHIEIKDYNPKGDVYMAKSRKTTYEERLEVVRYCLANNREYKLAAEHYNLSYSQVYQWIKKYEEEGEEGLRDRRGRKQK